MNRNNSAFPKELGEEHVFLLRGGGVERAEYNNPLKMYQIFVREQELWKQKQKVLKNGDKDVFDIFEAVNICRLKEKNTFPKRKLFDYSLNSHKTKKQEAKQ